MLADSVTDELNMLSKELVKAKRLLDENSVDKETEEKRKKNLEIDVRHLVALKAQKYKEIRNLQVLWLISPPHSSGQCDCAGVEIERVCGGSTKARGTNKQRFGFHRKIEIAVRVSESVQWQKTGK